MATDSHNLPRQMHFTHKRSSQFDLIISDIHRLAKGCVIVVMKVGSCLQKIVTMQF